MALRSNAGHKSMRTMSGILTAERISRYSHSKLGGNPLSDSAVAASNQNALFIQIASPKHDYGSVVRRSIQSQAATQPLSNRKPAAQQSWLGNSAQGDK